MKKLILFLSFVCVCIHATPMLPVKNNFKLTEIKVEKNVLYKGKAMETFYTATFENMQGKRHFEVIKTNAELKSFFLADYLLVEKKVNNELLYYPIGWTTDKIKTEEIRSNCMEIVSGKVKPVKPE